MTDNENGVDRVYIERSKRDKIEEIRDRMRSSPLYNCENSEIYMLAFVIGYVDGERMSLDNPDGFVQFHVLGEKNRAIVEGVICAEMDLDILLDKPKLYEIADEYANSGITLLHERIKSSTSGTLLKNLEERIHNEIDKNKIERAL